MPLLLVIRRVPRLQFMSCLTELVRGSALSTWVRFGSASPSHLLVRTDCSELVSYCKQEKPSLPVLRVRKHDSAGNVSQPGWEGGLLQNTLWLTKQHPWPPPSRRAWGRPPSLGRSNAHGTGLFVRLSS